MVTVMACVDRFGCHQSWNQASVKLKPSREIKHTRFPFFWGGGGVSFRCSHHQCIRTYGMAVLRSPGTASRVVFSSSAASPFPRWPTGTEYSTTRTDTSVCARVGVRSSPRQSLKSLSRRQHAIHPISNHRPQGPNPYNTVRITRLLTML